MVLFAHRWRPIVRHGAERLRRALGSLLGIASVLIGPTMPDELDVLVQLCAEAHHPDPQSMDHARHDVRAALVAAGANIRVLERFDARYWPA